MTTKPAGDIQAIHVVGSHPGPYKPDSAQHQIDFWKLRAGMLEDQLDKARAELKALKALKKGGA